MGKYLIAGLLIAASALGFYLYVRRPRGKVEQVSAESPLKIQPVGTGADLFDSDPTPLSVETLPLKEPIFEVSPTPVELEPTPLPESFTVVREYVSVFKDREMFLM